jgi:hypothetical protein
MPNPITSTPTSPLREPNAAQRRLLDDQAGFAAVLSRARESASGDEARDVAEKLVAVAFVQPVLAKMRESTQAAVPFQPNQAEKAFRGMMDSSLAEKIVRSSNWPLVQRIEENIAKASPDRALRAMRESMMNNAAGADVAAPLPRGGHR